MTQKTSTDRCSYMGKPLLNSPVQNSTLDNKATVNFNRIWIDSSFLFDDKIGVDRYSLG